MAIFKQSARNTVDETFARLERHGRAKVEAAERIASALGEANVALLDLLKADSAFFGEAAKLGGVHGQSSMRVSRELRTLLLGQLEITAPDLATRLLLPRRNRASCSPLPEMVARWVEMDTPARAES